MGFDRHPSLVSNTPVNKNCSVQGGLETDTESINRLNFSNPTILNLDNTTFDPFYAVIPENYTQGYVYLVLTAQNLSGFPAKTNAQNNHPIHLHGHDFAILAQSQAPYDVNTSISTFNFNNPPRRDVALLPIKGYLAIAFRPDNPGVWLLHCHIGKILFLYPVLALRPSVIVFNSIHPLQRHLISS